MDREQLEARVRELAASAEETKIAAEALLRELLAEREEGEVAPMPDRPPDARMSPSAPPRAPIGRGDDPAPAPSTETGDQAGARLVAMKLALDGVPRDQAAKRITDDFGITNPESLIDDVYKRAGASPA